MGTKFDNVVTGYVTDEEYAMIQELADMEKRSMSNLVRATLLKECRRNGIEKKEYLVEEE